MLDTIASKIAALGAPGLVLAVVISSTGYTGAAAITASLALIGPFGMIGGLATLGIIGLLSEALAEYGSEAVCKAILKNMYENGETEDSLLKKINSFKISKKMKLKLTDFIENYPYLY